MFIYLIACLVFRCGESWSTADATVLKLRPIPMPAGINTAEQTLALVFLANRLRILLFELLNGQSSRNVR